MHFLFLISTLILISKFIQSIQSHIRTFNRLHKIYRLFRQLRCKSSKRLQIIKKNNLFVSRIRQLHYKSSKQFQIMKKNNFRRVSLIIRFHVIKKTNYLFRENCYYYKYDNYEIKKYHDYEIYCHEICCTLNFIDLLFDLNLIYHDVVHDHMNIIRIYQIMKFHC